VRSGSSERRRQIHGLALRGVVHAQVVADLADDHVPRVEAHARGEAQPVLEPQLVGELAQRVPHRQGRQTRALGVILVSNRCAEQRHDAVARVLVDRAFEAVDAVGQDFEEAIHDPVQLLGIDRLGQLHRALHVREQDGDLLALALEGGLRLEDLVGQVLRGVVAGSALRCRSSHLPGRRSRFRIRWASLDRSRGDPRQDLALERGHLLHVHELLDQLLEGLVVELELAPQGSEGQAPVPLQQRPRPLDRLDEAHGRPLPSPPSVWPRGNPRSTPGPIPPG
jgi:hypothetical protein